jgi:hypothetical protein
MKKGKCLIGIKSLKEMRNLAEIINCLSEEFYNGNDYGTIWFTQGAVTGKRGGNRGKSYGGA